MIEDMALMMLMLVIVVALFGIMLGISIGIMICTDDKKCIRKVSFDSKKCTVHEIQYKLLENGKDYSTLPHDAKMGKRTSEAMGLDEDSNITK